MSFETVMNRTRLIVVAIMGPMIAFTAAAFVLRQAGNDSDAPLLIALAAVVALALPTYLIVRRQMTASIRQRSSPDDGAALLGAYQTLTIIGAALAEGVGLFAAVILYVTGNVVAVAGSAVALAGLLASIPTTAGVDSFLIAATGRAREGRWA